MMLSRATQLVPLSASLQKYVEIQIIVPLCTNAPDVHPIPVLADGGKQVQVWIYGTQGS